MQRKSLKRIGAAVMAGAVAVSAAACGNAGGDADNSESVKSTENENVNVSAAAGTSEDSAEIYWFSTVSGWGPSGWVAGMDTDPLMDTLKEKFGITFNFEQPPTDADTKLGLMIASNELPDMISVTDADTVKQLIASDKVWDMKSFLEQYDPESHLLSDFPEDIKETLTNTYGGWYSLPSHLNSDDTRKLYPPCDEVYEDLVTKASNGAIMFNKTMMEELGITQEDVQTEEGFYEACEKVKNSGHQVEGQAVIPVMLHGNLWIESSLDYIIAENFGAVQVDENGDYRHMELSPGYKNALKFVNNCIRDGYLDINSLTIDETALKTYVESGRVFCWIGNCAQSSKKETIPYVSFGPIVAENNARPVLGVEKQAGGGWIQTFISKECKNPEKIAEMMSFATSREGLLLNDYGVEGTDYTVDEKGNVTRTEEGQKRWETEYKKNIGLWPFANTCFTRSVEAPPSEDTDTGVFMQIAAALGKYEDTYIYDASLLSFVKSAVVEPSSDLGIKLSQIKSYLESQKAKIVSAASEEAFEAEYNNMVSELEKYQVADIDAEYNKLLEENEKAYGETIEDVNAGLYK